MRRLNRWNDIVFSVKCKVLRVNDLRMLDAPSQIVFAFQIFRVFVENHPHTAVTYGMATDLIACLVCLFAHMVVEILVFDNQS